MIYNNINLKHFKNTYRLLYFQVRNSGGTTKQQDMALDMLLQDFKRKLIKK